MAECEWWQSFGSTATDLAFCRSDALAGCVANSVERELFSAGRDLQSIRAPHQCQHDEWPETEIGSTICTLVALGAAASWKYSASTLAIGNYLVLCDPYLLRSWVTRLDHLAIDPETTILCKILVGIYCGDCRFDHVLSTFDNNGQCDAIGHPDIFTLSCNTGRFTDYRVSDVSGELDS